jgi:hypothetical protein
VLMDNRFTLEDVDTDNIIIIWLIFKPRFVQVCDKLDWIRTQSNGEFPVNIKTLKMEIVCFSELSTHTDESTRRQNPQEHY